MHYACKRGSGSVDGSLLMEKTLQVRGLDEEVVAKLKARAAYERMSLSSYAAKILTDAVERPTREELRARMEALSELGGGATGEAILAAIREVRGE
jgi:plasmid stability protein